VSKTRTGLAHAREQPYDLIVLDVMLPGLDGWSLLRELRRERDTPVLFLTARDELQDRLMGLELGADDYMVKPFAIAELVMRIRTILRRGPLRESEFIERADLQIDAIRRCVTRAGQKIDLTSKDRRRGEAIRERQPRREGRRQAHHASPRPGSPSSST